MSIVTVVEFKAYAAVIGSADDARIQLLIDGAEDEALQFLGRKTLPRTNEPCPRCCDDCESESDITSLSDLDPVSDSGDLAPVVRNAILLLTQTLYEIASPNEMTTARAVAISMLRPYRCGLGI